MKKYNLIISFCIIFISLMTIVSAKDIILEEIPDLEAQESAVVYVVHAIDTETKNRDDFKFNQELDLSPYDEGGQVDRSFDLSWREEYLDSFGGIPIYTWYLMTHEAYCESNQGCDAVVDVMLSDYLDNIKMAGDELGWHYHHSDWVGGKWTPLYTFDGTIYREKTDREIAQGHLAKMVLDYGFFPENYKSGWAWENTDLSNWLENFALFDYSNFWHNIPSNKNKWTTYHPSSENLRVEGEMNRYIAKCLPGTMGQEDVNQAFELAQEQGKAILCYYSHSDVGNTLLTDAENIYPQLVEASNQYNISFQYAGGKEAINLLSGQTDKTPPKLSKRISNNVLEVNAIEALTGKPLVFTKENGEYNYHEMVLSNENNWEFDLADKEIDELVITATDTAGNSYVGEKINPKGMCQVDSPPCGDINGDGNKDISDLISLVSYIFKDGFEPCEMSSADVDNSGEVDISDLVIYVDLIFGSGTELECIS